MDPRHPELVLSRVKELIAQYEKVESKIKSATFSSQLGGFEREGSLVIQEICLTAPRLHEAMMLVSRNRRKELAQGVSNQYAEMRAYAATAEKVAEIPTAPNQAEVYIAEPKPRKKKKTSKKKAE